ncbi:hypothetical protein NGRA_3005 [Nosema granulosis]|uniref:Uncharacterized protein n=1 Tax=Nosema granulosis TaxID=83296 RepID=A0A9P6GX18_9MICR|nr:hypothetical protein NGRA_3005 [Nosema granulosis]
MKIITNFKVIYFWFSTILGTPSDRWFCSSKCQRDIITKRFKKAFTSQDIIAINKNDNSVMDEFIFLSLNPYSYSFEIFSGQFSKPENRSYKNYEYESSGNVPLSDENFGIYIALVCENVVDRTIWPRTDLYFFFEKGSYYNFQLFGKKNLKKNIKRFHDISKRYLPRYFIVKHITSELTAYLYGLCTGHMGKVNVLKFKIPNYEILIFKDKNFDDILRKELEEVTSVNDDKEIGELADKHLYGTVFSALSDQMKNNLLVLSMFNTMKVVYSNPMSFDSVYSSGSCLFVLCVFLLNKKEFKSKLKTILENNKDNISDLLMMYNTFMFEYKSQLRNIGAFHPIDSETEDVSKAFYSFIENYIKFENKEMNDKSSRLVARLFSFLVDDEDIFPSLVLSEEEDRELTIIKSLREKREEHIVSYWLRWSKLFSNYLITDEIETDVVVYKYNEDFKTLKEKCIEWVLSTISDDNMISEYVYETYSESIRRNVEKW